MDNIDDKSLGIELGNEFNADSSKISVTDVLKIFGSFVIDTTFYKSYLKNVSANIFPTSVYESDMFPFYAGSISISLGVVVTFSVVYLSFSYFHGGNSNHSSNDDASSKKKDIEDAPVLRDFTIEQLRTYDGVQNKEIYIGLRGDVYDVSDAVDFYGEGSGYHCFAGREASRAMARLSFDEVDLNSLNLDDLSPFDKSNLDDWVDKFKYYKCYPIVGKVSLPPPARQFTREELNGYKGSQEVPKGRIDAPIYMTINGKVLDVSYGGKEMYGVGGPYHLFAGIDASRALAKMSFKPEDLTSDISDLTQEELKTLNDWEKKFLESKAYPVVGYL